MFRRFLFFVLTLLVLTGIFCLFIDRYDIPVSQLTKEIFSRSKILSYKNDVILSGLYIYQLCLIPYCLDLHGRWRVLTFTQSINQVILCLKFWIPKFLFFFILILYILYEIQRLVKYENNKMIISLWFITYLELLTVLSLYLKNRNCFIDTFYLCRPQVFLAYLKVT